MDLTKLKLSLFDELLDVRCETYGEYDTIEWLARCGCTQDEIIALGFDKEDVIFVMKSMTEF